MTAKESLFQPSLFALGDSDYGFSRLLLRMLFSCLVDAEYMKTEEFKSQGKTNRFQGEKMCVIDKKLTETIQRKYGHSNKPINIKRTEILNCCINKAPEDKGLFTLTVPTGGGKTAASLAFSVKHALGIDAPHHLRIPYHNHHRSKSGVFADFIGNEKVLEHHSNFSYESKGE